MRSRWTRAAWSGTVDFPAGISLRWTARQRDRPISGCRGDVHEPQRGARLRQRPGRWRNRRRRRDRRRLAETDVGNIDHAVGGNDEGVRLAGDGEPVDDTRDPRQYRPEVGGDIGSIQVPSALAVTVRFKTLTVQSWFNCGVGVCSETSSLALSKSAHVRPASAIFCLSFNWPPRSTRCTVRDAVRLRNAHLAVVDRRKVTDYLLDPEHPRNAGKSAFFETLGFSRDAPEELVEGLKRLSAGDVIESVEPTHGDVYAVEGLLIGPDATRPVKWRGRFRLSTSP